MYVCTRVCLKSSFCSTGRTVCIRECVCQVVISFWFVRVGVSQNEVQRCSPPHPASAAGAARRKGPVYENRAFHVTHETLITQMKGLFTKQSNESFNVVQCIVPGGRHPPRPRRPVPPPAPASPPSPPPGAGGQRGVPVCVRVRIEVVVNGWVDSGNRENKRTPEPSITASA